MEQKVADVEGIHWLNQSNRLDDEQIGEKGTLKVFPWTESTASSPTDITMSASEMDHS